MTALVERGVRRKSAADAFLSHLSEDDNQARELADLAVLGVDVWLDSGNSPQGIR